MLRNKQNVFISGVSRGIGKELSLYHLRKGDHVYGVSRSINKELLEFSNFHYISLDLSKTELINPCLDAFLSFDKELVFERIYLNAGLIDDIYKISEIDISKFNYILSVNLIAYKQILDFFIHHDLIQIKEVVVSASIAGVRPRAGMSAYAVSKSALNMLMSLYAIENPSIFFVVVGLCIFDSVVSQKLSHDNRKIKYFGELEALASRFKKQGYLVSAEERKNDLIYVLDHLSELNISSGVFFEIRDMLKLNSHIDS